jgi:hypothetical protein
MWHVVLASVLLALTALVTSEYFARRSMHHDLA